MSVAKCYQATPHGALLEQIMDSTQPKSEREWAASREVEALRQRIRELEADCERERLCLAACGTAALGYFDGCKDEYKSASLDDVLRLKGRYDAERTDLERERLASDKLEKALNVAKAFCDGLTAEECPDTVAIPINAALAEVAILRSNRHKV